MNTELLLAVKAAILAKPARYAQEEWCGTACCIAGHTVRIAEPATYTAALKEKSSDYLCGGSATVCDAAKRLLALDKDGFYNLCYSGEDWPEPFATELAQAGTPRARSKVAARRIDHFIATGGAE